jgi:hypothetical protein
VAALLAAPHELLFFAGCSEEQIELAQVLADIDEVEPLLRRSADLIVDTTAPVTDVADAVLSRVASERRERERGIHPRGGPPPR